LIGSPRFSIPWALAFTVLLHSGAHACQGPWFHYGIFFDDIPEIDNTLVARIAITSLITDPTHPAARDGFQVARARVDQVFRGDVSRREIIVRVRGSSCGPWLREGSGVVVGIPGQSSNNDFELTLIAEAHYKHQARKKPKLCELPPAGNASKIIVYGSYQGHGFPTSSNWFNSKPGVARVLVEDGDTPLYLVLQNKTSIIWRFEGAIRRLERVVLATLPYGFVADVEGVPRDRIASVPCLPDFLMFPDFKTNIGQAAVREALLRSLGRRVDAFDGSEMTYGVGVPSFTRLPREAR
jgi:hypothetical protein